MDIRKITDQYFVSPQIDTGADLPELVDKETVPDRDETDLELSSLTSAEPEKSTHKVEVLDLPELDDFPDLSELPELANIN